MTSGEIPPFGHALVLHGTGMLRPVSLALAAGGGVVGVVARRRAPLESLAREAAQAAGHIVPLACDTDDTEAFLRLAGQRMDEVGPFDLVVSWGVATATLRALGQAVGERGAWRLLHIRGSVAADPADPLAEEVETLSAMRHVTYQRVVLGWAGPPGRPRWLARGEIAAGVLQALAAPQAESVVGRVRPWAERPAW